MLRSMGPMFGPVIPFRTVSFDEVMTNKEGELLTLFRRHLVMEYSIENLRFIEDVTKWKQAAIESLTKTENPRASGSGMC